MEFEKLLGLGIALDQAPYMIIGETQFSDDERKTFNVTSPIDGSLIAKFPYAHVSESNLQKDGDLEVAIQMLGASFKRWRMVPAPRRGELVRRIGEQARLHKEVLAELITWEMGKTRQEALGEVQEWIDICEFAVGLSRQLYGLTIASERPNHRLMEQWHPLGIVGVITAFNFPMAVWAWNAMLALVCGNTVVWKPSEKTPICAMACHNVMQTALDSMDDIKDLKLSAVIFGDYSIGQEIAYETKIPLVSATGSTRMGVEVAKTVAERLGRSLLELGGNNAMIVTPSADIDLVVRAATFSALGTTGQRCTTLRRLIVHESIIDTLSDRLVKVFMSVKIGDPRNDGILMGPLIDKGAYENMRNVIDALRRDGASSVVGGNLITENVPKGGIYVEPALARVNKDNWSMSMETFAPIMYITPYKDLDEAIEINNSSSYGLSSAIFTDSVLESERFLSPEGSDCGIANINIGTSGAEIGGAFGGEKDTGGGRESGSDSWKSYMRRQTVTVNYGRDLPLSQGIEFDV